VGSALLIVVLLSGSHEQFVANFNALMTPIIGVEDPYNAIIASAAANGWTVEGADWVTTLKLSNWSFLPLLGAAFSISIAGEIKSVEKAQTYGMLGAIVITVVIWVITIPLANSVFGYDFLGSAVFNYFTDPATVTTPPVTTPTDASITLMAGILTNSWLVTLLCSVGLILWMWMWIPGMHTFSVRAMVAWAFDRIAPSALGTISQTRHTPTVAIWVGVLITIIFMALFVFTSYFATVVIMIEAALLAWSIVLLAGIFFPYTRAHIYEKSPIAGKKVLGLPMMTVGCALGFLGSQFYFWTLFFDDIAAGHKPDQLALVFGLFVIGIIFFFIMKVYRKTQGVDVNLAFKEIPIE
jgi:amino acid transporter